MNITQVVYKSYSYNNDINLSTDTITDNISTEKTKNDNDARVTKRSRYDHRRVTVESRYDHGRVTV